MALLYGDKRSTFELLLSNLGIHLSQLMTILMIQVYFLRNISLK